MQPSRKVNSRFVIGLYLVAVCLAAPLTDDDVDNCTHCLTGFGVKAVCNGTEDTVCEPCPKGFHSETNSPTDPCIPCSRCGKGMFELEPCKSDQDVFCELCTWSKAPHNEDFVSKCMMGTYLENAGDSKHGSIPMDVPFFRVGGAKSVGDIGSDGDEGPKVGGVDVEVPQAETPPPPEPTGPRIGGIGVDHETNEPVITPPPTTVKYTGPRIGGVGMDRQTLDPEDLTKAPTEPYTGPQVIGIGADRNTVDPNGVKTPAPTDPYTGPRFGGVGIDRDTPDPGRRIITDDPKPYTGPRVGGMGLDIDTPDPSEELQPTKKPYAGPRIGGIGVLHDTPDPGMTLKPPTKPYTGPRVQGVGVEHKVFDPRLMTLKPPTKPYTGPRIKGIGAEQREGVPVEQTEKPYTGPRVLGVGAERIIHEPQSTTKKPYTGPRVGNMGADIKAVDPSKLTPTPPPYTGPRIGNMGADVKDNPDVSTIATTAQYTGPRVGGIGLLLHTTTPLPTTPAPNTTVASPNTTVAAAEVTESTGEESESEESEGEEPGEEGESVPEPEEEVDTKNESNPIRSAPKDLGRVSHQTQHFLSADKSDPELLRRHANDIEENEEEIREEGFNKSTIGFIVGGLAVAFVVVGVAYGFRRMRKSRNQNQMYELAPQTIPALPLYHEVRRTPIYIDSTSSDPPPKPPRLFLPLETSIETEPTSLECQSPVDIDANMVDPDDALEKNPLIFKYVPANSKSISNTGATVRVDVDTHGSLLTGGPLSSKFVLHHFEFRWGSTDESGSEHSVEGRHFPAEVQLVHWNSQEHSNFSDAEKSENGLAIVSVFLQTGEADHAGLRKLVQCLSNITYKGESRQFPGHEFDPASLFPEKTSNYWTYIGSTSTPPHHESVTWVVFRDPITVSTQQLEEFRKLRPYEKEETHLLQADGHVFLGDNARPTQPLGDRNIRASFV